MPLEHQIDTPLAAAVRKAGSQSAFARLVGRRQSTVNDWLRLQKAVPAENVLTIEAELGLSRHELRPDIYPVDHVAAPLRELEVEEGIAKPLAPQTKPRGGAGPE